MFPKSYYLEILRKITHFVQNGQVFAQKSGEKDRAKGQNEPCAYIITSIKEEEAAP
ncbi:MAG: hypothetical protein PUC38_05850 [Bacteroidales bacterium]|nr:hypothetical protein [Bacteroidales bacterium]